MNGSAPGGDPPAASSVEVIVQDERAGPDAPAVDVGRLQRLVADVLGDEGVEGPAEVGLRLLDTAEMAALHASALGGAGPTDVLSFPLDGLDDGIPPGVPRLVGDIVICPAVAAGQAVDHAGTLPDELALLAVHGALHLLGHDHAEPAERERMWRRERELVGQRWGEFSRDPWVGDAVDGLGDAVDGLGDAVDGLGDAVDGRGGR